MILLHQQNASNKNSYFSVGPPTEKHIFVFAYYKAKLPWLVLTYFLIDYDYEIVYRIPTKITSIYICNYIRSEWEKYIHNALY